ncbi:MAG TPA: hypothetical protein VIC33_12560 [Vicinamibacterales bacterium]
MSWWCVLIAIALVVSPVVHADEIIDRVMAVVGTQIVTLSDVRMVQVFGLTNGPQFTDSRPQATGHGPQAAAADVLQQLIDRDLMLQEVEHYAPPEPDPSDVSRALSEVRRRFPDQAAYDRALVDNGIDDTRLRAFVRDNLRLRAYLDERFPPPPLPAESEVVEYYQTHPDEFSKNGKALPYNTVRDDIVTRLTESRRAGLIKDWLAGLRSRGDVTVVGTGE